MMRDIYKRLMEYTGDGVYRYAFEDGKILLANQGFVNILGLDCKPDELAGKCLKDVLIYTDKEGTLRHILEREGEIRGFEYHFKTLKGEERWVIHDAILVVDPDTKQRLVETIVKDITQRKKSEQELAANEERLRVTLRSIGDGVIATDAAGTIVLMNAVAEQLTGWSQEAAIGRPMPEIFRIINEKTRQPCVNPVEKVLRSGTVVGLANHTAIISRDGIERSIADSGAPIRDSGGKIIGVVLVFRDVTESKQVAEVMRRSEEHHRAILKTAMDGIWLMDTQGRLLEVNDTYCRMSCYSVQELLAMHVSDLDVKELKNATSAHMQKIIAQGEDRFESRQRRKDGSIFDVEVSIQYRPEEGGQFVAFLRDITAQKQMEIQAQMAREVLECLNQITITKEVIGKILQIIKRIMGFDAVGIRLREGDDYPYFVHDGFSGDFLRAENTLTIRAEDGGVCRNEDGTVCLECTCGLVLSGKTDSANPLFTTGGSFWTNNTLPLLDLSAERDPRLHPRNRCIHAGFLSLALIPLRSGEKIIGLLQLSDHRRDQFTPEIIRFFESLGASIGIAFVRSQAEQSLLNANMQLGQSLDALNQVQDKIIQQERLSALGQMASGIAHDFNNVLMPIVGFSELLMSDHAVMDDREEALHMIKAINAAGNDARQIVSRLRTIYRRDDSARYEKVDVARIVESAISLTMPKWKEEMNAKGSTVEIATDFQPAPQIKGNASELREVMTNLIFNAIDAMPNGGVLTFRLYCEKNISVILEVTDTGLGMSQETLLHCEEPFFTTKGAQGSGLGLAMVYGIIERHSGAIEIKSKPNVGTTVRMRLPVFVEAESIDKEKHSKSVQLSPLKILVIDDEVRSRKIVVRLLESDGHYVEKAEGGSEGLALLRQNKFDFIVTDRAMPVMNGDEVARKAQEIQPGIHIIMLTGFGDIMKDSGECPLGVDRIMTKPVTFSELNRIMASVMRKAGEGR